MYSFILQSWFTFKGLYTWLNRWGYPSSVIIQPFATVIMFVILGKYASNPEAVRSYAMGIAVSSMAMIAIVGLTQSYTKERFNGGTSFVFITPVNRLTHYIARSVLHIPNALVAFFFSMLAALLIIDLDFGAVNWWAFVLAVIVTDFSIVAFGQLLGVCSVAVRDWYGMQGLANGILLILCGVIIPVSVFPVFLQEIAKLLPITNGLIAVKAAFAGTATAGVSGNILREFLTGIAYYTIAYFAFIFFEKVVKRTGALEREEL
jgi:ABC-2 type transport system permease protein